MMASDDKPTHDEVLDFTPEQWERHRWLAEREAHERELQLKEREDRRSFFTNPLLLGQKWNVINRNPAHSSTDA